MHFRSLKFIIFIIIFFLSIYYIFKGQLILKNYNKISFVKEKIDTKNQLTSHIDSELKPSSKETIVNDLDKVNIMPSKKDSYM